MSDISDQVVNLRNKVTAEGTVIDGAVTAFQGLAQAYKDAIANAADDAAAVAAIKELNGELDSQTQNLATAVANVPQTGGTGGGAPAPTPEEITAAAHPTAQGVVSPRTQ